MNLRERFELDRDTHRLIFRRDVNATTEAVFDAWTRPEQVTKWWDPEGRDLAQCDIDLRVGGRFSFVNTGREDHPFAGEYTTISRPTYIAFVAMGANGSVVLTPQGHGTRMVVEITCGSAEHLEQFVKMGIADGTAQTLDNLLDFVEKHTA